MVFPCLGILYRLHLRKKKDFNRIACVGLENLSPHSAHTKKITLCAAGCCWPATPMGAHDFLSSIVLFCIFRGGVCCLVFLLPQCSLLFSLLVYIKLDFSFFFRLMCQYGAKAKQVLYTQRLGSILKPPKNGHGKTTTRNDYFKSVCCST